MLNINLENQNLNNFFINQLEEELLLIDDNINNINNINNIDYNSGILILNKKNLYNKSDISNSNNNIKILTKSKNHHFLQCNNNIIIYIIIFWILNNNKIINMINFKYSNNINLLIRTSIFAIIIYFIKFFSHYII